VSYISRPYRAINGFTLTRLPVARIRVVLDACVLLTYQLADLLLRLADAERYEPL
jgi:hypothetical protein